jgi:phosphomannomutase
LAARCNSENTPIFQRVKSNRRSRVANACEIVRESATPCVGLRKLVRGKLACLGTVPLFGTLNERDSPLFSRPPGPTAEHLHQTAARVAEAGVAVGFVQDPDADRLALIDETGRYIGEEYTLVLAARSVLAHRKGPLATNLSTSRMIDDVAAAAGVTVYRTPVGEANVAAAVAEHGCILGGEGNGGVIDPRVVPVRDSLTGMALVADLLARTGQSLSRLVAELPRYHMVKKKMPLPTGGVAAMLQRVAAAAAGGQVNDADGVRIDWPAGWVHVRASNTEPACRVIAEARDEAETNKILQHVAAAIGPAPPAGR